ncbi:MAG TPA: hypothetical protein VKT72_09805 [Candidatus Baltobacteraceae bacterium]|nr:hypothetical protein [Candidatus Baltobacteraceae bacterium]
MNEDEEPRRRLRRLKSLATGAGFSVRRHGSGYELSFHGTYRDFDIRCVLGNGWLHTCVYILQLPALSATRSRLLERIAELNLAIPLAKFTKSEDVLCLDLEYREEHVDSAVFGKLANLLRQLAEEHYPEIFRIVSGQERLDALQAAFQRPSTVPE